MWRLFRRRPLPILGLCALFVGYFLAFAWYSPVASGNRFLLGLFLPYLFCVCAFLQTFAARTRAYLAFNVAVSLWLAAEIFLISSSRILTMSGGH